MLSRDFIFKTNLKQRGNLCQFQIIAFVPCQIGGCKKYLNSKFTALLVFETQANLFLVEGLVQFLTIVNDSFKIYFEMNFSLAFNR